MSNILRKIKRDGGRRVQKVCEKYRREKVGNLGRVVQIFSADDYFEFCEERDINKQVCKCGSKLYVHGTEKIYDKNTKYSLFCTNCGGKYGAMTHDSETSEEMRVIFECFDYDKEQINDYFHQNAEKEGEV